MQQGSGAAGGQVRATLSGLVPRHANTIVVGGGTSGSVVAGVLAERSDETVLVLEAGPDYGPFAAGHWPQNLLDARALGYTDAWDYDSGDTYADRIVPFERARVIGGCSSHNGCAAIWGSRADYDGWAALGEAAWSASELRPLFRHADARLRVRKYAPSEITPFHQALLDAAPGIGIPLVEDLNDLEQDTGIAASPVNIHDGVRWNAAFAYLDPVRDRPNLTVIGDTTVDRLIVAGDRVVAVEAIVAGTRYRIETDRVVVSAGAYGSPAVLLRSGIGDPGELPTVGIAPVLDLPGVGRNLHDHPSAIVTFGGTSVLDRQMAGFASTHWTPEEQTIAKARSTRCTEAFDLHLYPVGGPDPIDAGAPRWKLPVACMTPRSRGRLTLRSSDPLAPIAIDHRYLSDPEGHDRAVLVDGLRLARELAQEPRLRNLLGSESSPGPAVRTDSDLHTFVDATCVHYYHPVGTCRMGPESDLLAVADGRGKIHGLANAFIADCSLIPVIPRANTNIPAVVIGERIARWLLQAVSS